MGKVDLAEETAKEGSDFKAEKSRDPRLEEYLPDLKMSLMSIAARFSTEYGNFFNAEAQITIDGPDGEYDKKIVADKELEFATDCQKTPAAWRASREKNPSHITELALTVLFNKILKGKFIIVRASDYDDYENGADMFIVDTDTGAVICGVDDVIRYDGDDVDKDSKTGKKPKAEKIKEKMEHGGASIKYGATFVDGQLARKSLEHIPLFYFSINKKDLDDLLVDLTERRQKINPKEKEVFAELVNSLADQFSQFSQDKNLNSSLKNNLRNFKPSLEKMVTCSKA